MPFCPKCGKDIKEQVNYCPNCSFPVANLFKEVERTQVPPQPAATPAPTVVKGTRTAPITAAAILCILVSVVGVIWSLIFFASNLMTTLGKMVFIMILLISVAIHLLGWLGLWGARRWGGAVGIIAGIYSLGAVIINYLIIMAYYLTIPLMIDSILGIILLIMIAIGWKTLK